MALQIGDSTVDKVYIGNDPVDKVYVGTDEVWSAFSLMGMDKVGNFNMGASGNYKITGWQARAGMAANIIGDGLVMNGARILTVNWGYSTSLNSSWGRAEIRKNNVVIASGLYGSGAVANVSVVAGDVLTMHGNNSYPGSQQVTPAGTYIYTSLT